MSLIIIIIMILIDQFLVDNYLWHFYRITSKLRGENFYYKALGLNAIKIAYSNERISWSFKSLKMSPIDRCYTTY